MRVLFRPDWAWDFGLKLNWHTVEQTTRKLTTTEHLIVKGQTFVDVSRFIEVTQPSTTPGSISTVAFSSWKPNG